jgi:hypothetical protein
MMDRGGCHCGRNAVEVGLGAIPVRQADGRPA